MSAPTDPSRPGSQTYFKPVPDVNLGVAEANLTQAALRIPAKCARIAVEQESFPQNLGL